MEIKTFDQQSAEWFEARKGKMSASHASEIGNCGKGLITYIRNMMAEYYSSAEKERFSSSDTDRGNELEPIARAVYELETGRTVKEVGLVEYSNYVVCSPDGLVDQDGLLEIKCPKDEVYFKYILDGEKAIDSKYMWQMQMQMLTTGREWCDFMAYNPNFKKSYFLHRVYPDPLKVEKLLEGFRLGEEMIREIKEKYEQI